MKESAEPAAPGSGGLLDEASSGGEKYIRPAARVWLPPKRLYTHLPPAVGTCLWRDLNDDKAKGRPKRFHYRPRHANARLAPLPPVAKAVRAPLFRLSPKSRWLFRIPPILIELTALRAAPRCGAPRGLA